MDNAIFCRACGSHLIEVIRMRTDGDGRHFFACCCMTCEHTAPTGRTDVEAYAALEREPVSDTAKFSLDGANFDIPVLELAPIPAAPRPPVALPSFPFEAVPGPHQSALRDDAARGAR